MLIEVSVLLKFFGVSEVESVDWPNFSSVP